MRNYKVLHFTHFCYYNNNINKSFFNFITIINISVIVNATNLALGILFNNRHFFLL